MKKLSLIKAVDYISHLPGNASIRVYYDLNSGDFLIYENSNSLNPDYLFCAGQPSKFFDALNIAIYNSVKK